MMPLDTIVAWLAGDLPAGELDAAEAHLLGCDACSALAGALGAVARGVDRLTRAGGLRAVMTAATAARLRDAGLPMREYRVAPGQVVACGIGATELFNLVAYEVDPGAARRVDLLMLGPDGGLLERIEDVPVDRQRGELWTIEAGDRLRQLPSIRLTTRLVAVDDDGSERPLGDYGLDHTGFHE